MKENSLNDSGSKSESNSNNSLQNNLEKSKSKSNKSSHKSSSQKNSEQSSHQSNQRPNDEGNFLQNLQNQQNSKRKSSNMSDTNAKNMNIIIDKLKLAFTKMKGEEKSQTFKMVLNNQDIIGILKELSRKNLEEIVVYILNEFGIEEKKDNLEINEANEKEERFKDLYFLAIKKGQIKILEALNRQEINFNKIVDNEGNTGLILAVITSDIQIAKFFLKYFPGMLEIKNNLDYSPLLLSVYNNDNLMFFLLANNLENVIVDGNSLLQLAIRNENLDIINYLNPYKNKNKCNFHPSELLLHFAVCQSSLEVFREIVSISKEYDYQIQPTLETPLHWAAMKGNYYIVKELIKLYKDNQIELDKKNYYGVTPFMLANLRQDKFICELFYENVVDANEQDNEGNSIAHLIAALGDVKWLKYMIKKFNVNCYLKNNQGNTPFIQAILNENVECVEFFIEMFKNSQQLISTNINWRNKYGQTPLHAAVFTGNTKIIEILLENKADITAIDANELTPYHYAYINEKEDVIQTIHKILNVK